MKKLFLILLFSLFFATTAFAKSAIIGFTALNGGGTGALDAVECEDILGDNTNRPIATGDYSIGVTSEKYFYIYRYNASGTDSESVPFIIVPDDRTSDCSGSGQWELVEDYSGNLVQNGGMEEGNPPTEWEAINTPETFERSAVQKHSGNYSAHIVDSTGSSGGMREWFTFLSNRIYKVSFWYRQASGRCTVGIWDGGGSPSFKLTESTTGEWLHYEDIFESSGGAGSGYVDLYNISDTDPAEFYIDDVRVEEVSSSNFITTGTIAGRIPRGADITGNVAHNTTDLHGKVYVFTAAATVTLDAAADAGYGASVCYRIRDASEAAMIDVQAAEKINLRGTALAVGVAITATGAGEYVCLIATTDTDGSGTDGWETWGITSAWASE